MLVFNHLVIKFLDSGNLWLLSLSDLNENHRKSNKCTLSDKVNLVVCQRSKKLKCFMETSSGATYTNSHGSSISEVWIVRLSQVLDAIWNSLWLSEQKESKIGKSSSLHIIVDVRYCEVEELLNSLVVGGSSIGSSNSVHSTISDNGVLGSSHLLNEGVGLFLFAVHLKSKCHRESSDDFFVILIINMSKNLLYRFLISSSNHNKTHSVSSCLSNDGRVSIAKENLL